MLDAFLEIHEKLRKVAIEYADHDEEREALAKIIADTEIRILL